MRQSMQSCKQHTQAIIRAGSATKVGRKSEAEVSSDSPVPHITLHLRLLSKLSSSISFTISRLLPSPLHLASECPSKLERRRQADLSNTEPYSTSSSMEFDLENPFTNFDRGDGHCSDVEASLFRIQADHMLSETYVKSLKLRDSDFIVRRETISLISQLCCRYDPFLSYLAVNYFDRFLSSQRLQKPKPWVFRLLALSCVSLAAKMQKTEFSLPCFQAGGGFVFDGQTIQRMEMLILGSLKWRMRSITPFSFLSFFIPMFKLEDPASRQALKARASEIIFKAQNDVKLLYFKPSDIAAAALLSASHDLFPFQFSGFQRAISGSSLVNKDVISRCYNAIQEVAMEGYESVVEVVSSSDTPINVLDLQFSAGESRATTGTSPASGTFRSERLLKRRRMGDLISNQTVQISQS